MHVVVDQLGNNVKVPGVAQRIVSLVPSQSEFLYDLGLGSRLVGVTKFCIRPPLLRKSCVVVGGTKNLNLSKIEELRPDLIVGNKEENDHDQIETLRARFPVWMSDVVTVKDALKMMEDLASITGQVTNGQKLLENIRHSLDSIKGLFTSQKILYLMWNDPIMVAAKGTYIDSLLNWLGLQNVASPFARYPVLTIDQMQELRPEIIFLSSEPYPFKQKHADHFQSLFPHTKVLLIDGEMLSWYGSRMVGLPKYCEQLLAEVTKLFQ